MDTTPAILNGNRKTPPRSIPRKTELRTVQVDQHATLCNFGVGPTVPRAVPQQSRVLQTCCGTPLRDESHPPVEKGVAAWTPQLRVSLGIRSRETCP